MMWNRNGQKTEVHCGRHGSVRNSKFRFYFKINVISSVAFTVFLVFHCVSESVMKILSNLWTFQLRQLLLILLTVICNSSVFYSETQFEIRSIFIEFFFPLWIRVNFNRISIYSLNRHRRTFTIFRTRKTVFISKSQDEWVKPKQMKIIEKDKIIMKSAFRTVLGVRTLTQTVLNRQMAHTKLSVSFGLARNGLERILEVVAAVAACTHTAYTPVNAWPHMGDRTHTREKPIEKM